MLFGLSVWSSCRISFGGWSGAGDGAGLAFLWFGVRDFVVVWVFVASEAMLIPLRFGSGIWISWMSVGVTEGDALAVESVEVGEAEAVGEGEMVGEAVAVGETVVLGEGVALGEGV